MTYPDNGFYSADAERSALGCALISSAALPTVCTLLPDDFYSPENKAIYTAIKAQYDAQLPIDLVTVDDRLMRLGASSQILTDRLIECSRYVPTAVNVNEYVALIREASQRRKLKAAIDKAAQDITSPENDAAVIRDTLLNDMREMQSTRPAWVDMRQMAQDAYQALIDRTSGRDRVIKSYLPSLDVIIGGFYPGELTIIGARPGVGKSALAASIAADAAFKTGAKVVVCSREMDSVQYGQRLLSRFAEVDGMKFRKPKEANEDELQRIVDVIPTMAEVPMSFTFSISTIEALRAEVQHKADRDELDMLVIDYLQLLRTSERVQSEHLRISHISRILKEIALEFKIPVIALSQLRRQGESPRMPRMDELKESGSLEQDADGVILIHRPEHLDDKSIPESDQKVFVEAVDAGRQYIVVDVAKQRQGQIGRTYMLFDPRYMRYWGVSRRGYAL